jgi:3'-phosphoadenosine 5'-phosphosulfate sulfotransferase (PAPS reductase)/FAD synthetase
MPAFNHHNSQADMFLLEPVIDKSGVTLDPDVETLLRSGCVVAVGVSGGKDSQACAIAVSRYLDAIGHSGPRVLVHSDLGRIEWRDSLPCCERLAEALGWELMVVRRGAGDMLARWQGRWYANAHRYSMLESVKVILPWSTPTMRFCTSELKTALICSALSKRFPTGDIVNVAGIRRQESPARQKKLVSSTMEKLCRKGSVGRDWNAIIDQPVEWVLETIASAGLSLHEAYGLGSSRVSCAFCIMSSLPDLSVAAACTDNHDVYNDLVALEAESTFAFQGGRWLGDVAPQLLSSDLLGRHTRAKQLAREREALESEIPDRLLFAKGWPTCLPTSFEADRLAGIRSKMGSLLNLNVAYTTGDAVIARFAELMASRPNC